MGNNWRWRQQATLALHCARGSNHKNMMLLDVYIRWGANIDSNKKLAYCPTSHSVQFKIKLFFRLLLLPLLLFFWKQWPSHLSQSLFLHRWQVLLDRGMKLHFVHLGASCGFAFFIFSVNLEPGLFFLLLIFCFRFRRASSKHAPHAQCASALARPASVSLRRPLSSFFKQSKCQTRLQKEHFTNAPPSEQLSHWSLCGNVHRTKHPVRIRHSTDCGSRLGFASKKLMMLIGLFFCTLATKAFVGVWPDSLL